MVFDFLNVRSGTTDVFDNHDDVIKDINEILNEVGVIKIYDADGVMWMRWSKA